MLHPSSCMLVNHGPSQQSFQRRIQAMEMGCYRKNTTHLIQRPCYQRGSPCQDPAGNWTTRRPPDNCKEMQTAVKGGRRQGRERKRWEDNIRELTGLEFGKSQRAVENREKWRKLIAKSSAVPQRPSRLKECECEGEGEDEIRRAGKKSCTCLKQISRNNMD